MKSKKVTLGEIGETPRKEYVYNANDPTDKYIYNSSPERPKTSRYIYHLNNYIYCLQITNI